MTHITTPPARTAAVRQAFASIQVVRIGRRQMTLSVWNQLPEYALDDSLEQEFWGIVHLCKCPPSLGEHIHVLGTIRHTDDEQSILARFIIHSPYPDVVTGLPQLFIAV